MPSGAVFIDRDGVLNRAVVRDGRPHPPASIDEFILLPRTDDACRMLKDAGFRLIVVTNQPDIARGTQSEEVVRRFHELLIERLPIDEVVVCPHDDADKCVCRKPAPGMLVGAAVRWNVELTESYMVGDRWRDIEAGHRAGCRTVWISSNYDEPMPIGPDAIVGDFFEAAETILQLEMSRAQGEQ